MTDYPRKEFEIALWRKVLPSGKEVLRGTLECAGHPLDGKRVQAWLETDKRNERGPDYRLKLDTWEPGQQREPAPREAYGREAPARRKPPEPEPLDDEIPW